MITIDRVDESYHKSVQVAIVKSVITTVTHLSKGDVADRVSSRRRVVPASRNQRHALLLLMTSLNLDSLKRKYRRSVDGLVKLETSRWRRKKLSKKKDYTIWSASVGES